MKFISNNRTTIFLITGSLLFSHVGSAQHRYKTDTIQFKPTKDVEVTMDVPAQKGTTIYIVNSTRNIDIKTWGENKVKVVSTVAVEEGAKIGTGTEMFEKSGITLRSASNRIELNSRGSSNTYTAHGGNIIMDGHLFYKEAHPGLIPTQIGNASSAITAYHPKRRKLTVFVPEGIKLNIDSRSSDILIRDNYKAAKFDLTSSNLDAQNIEELSLLAKYSMVNLGDVNDAQVEFENGTLRAMNIKQLDIDSKSSTIEYETGDNIFIRSQRDNYSIESIKRIEGRKQYGELRINKLHNLLDIEGNNADIKIRNIMDEVEKIKLSNKYADVRLPVRNLESYSVAFEGNYSTVFAPFEKTVIREDKKQAEAKVSLADDEKSRAALTETRIGASGGSTTTIHALSPTRNINSLYTQRNGEISPSKFTASVGDAKGKKTKLELVCHSCTIDFK